MTKNSKSQTFGFNPFSGHTEKLNFLVIEYCNLEFICYLVLVIWCFLATYE